MKLNLCLVNRPIVYDAHSDCTRYKDSQCMLCTVIVVLNKHIVYAAHFECTVYSESWCYLLTVIVQHMTHSLC